MYIISYAGAGYPLVDFLNTRGPWHFFTSRIRLIHTLLDVKGKVAGIIQVLAYGHRPSRMRSSSDLYDWFMEVRSLFKVESWCLMCLQNTATYIAGKQSLAELGSTRGLGRIELISQESKFLVRES